MERYRADLDEIRTLYREPYSMTLWGLTYVPKTHPGARQPDWIYLGNGGWFASASVEEAKRIRDWVQALRERGIVPMAPGEWSVIRDYLP